MQPARVFFYRMSRKTDRNGKMSNPIVAGGGREEDRAQVKYLRHGISLCTFLQQGTGPARGTREHTGCLREATNTGKYAKINVFTSLMSREDSCVSAKGRI